LDLLSMLLPSSSTYERVLLSRRFGLSLRLHRIRGGHKTNGNAMEGLGAGQRRGGTWWAAKNELTDRLAPRQLLTGTNSRRSRAETPPGFV
jgi:hypothetical protein